MNTTNTTLHTETTPWSRVLLEKLTTVTLLQKKYPAFYGTRRFITVFTRARQQPHPLTIMTVEFEQRTANVTSTFRGHKIFCLKANDVV
jgi:hypothetical protein